MYIFVATLGLLFLQAKLWWIVEVFRARFVDNKILEGHRNLKVGKKHVGAIFLNSCVLAVIASS